MSGGTESLSAASRDKNSNTRGLTEQDNDTEQYGHQSSSREAIWEGQDLGVTRLHVSTAVTCTHTHDQRAGAALNGVIVVWDHHRQEVHAHLAAAEPSPSCQDVGGVVCRQMHMDRDLRTELKWFSAIFVVVNCSACIMAFTHGHWSLAN